MFGAPAGGSCDLFKAEGDSGGWLMLDFSFPLQYFKIDLMDVKPLLDTSVAHRGWLLSSAPRTLLSGRVLVLWCCGKGQMGWSVGEAWGGSCLSSCCCCQEVGGAEVGACCSAQPSAFQVPLLNPLFAGSC